MADVGRRLAPARQRQRAAPACCSCWERLWFRGDAARSGGPGPMLQRRRCLLLWCQQPLPALVPGAAAAAAVASALTPTVPFPLPLPPPPARPAACTLATRTQNQPNVQSATGCRGRTCMRCTRSTATRPPRLGSCSSPALARRWWSARLWARSPTGCECCSRGGGRLGRTCRARDGSRT